MRTTDHPPAPPGDDGSTLARWEHQRFRRRMLEGAWTRDLRQRLERLLGERRARMQGRPDTSRNVFRSIVNQLATLYDSEPLVKHDDQAGLEVMRGLLADAGVWQLAQGHARNVVGLRESLWRVDVVALDGQAPRLSVRCVTPDLVTCEAEPDEPDVPVTVIEYRLRKVPGTQQKIWTRDVLSIADPAQPVYRVEDAEGKADLTADYLGRSASGDAYPYRAEDGSPVLPYVLTHAQRTGRLFDWLCGLELVDGALSAAVYWTMWGHIVRDCAHPQRWGINVQIGGAQSDGQDRYIEVDAASIVHFEQADQGAQSSLGQFSPGGDPVALGEAIRAFESELAVDFDISPSDLQRASGDARSGYAIHVTKEGQRSAQRRYEPEFRRSDLRLLSTIAAIWNSHPDTVDRLPESGWSIEYRGIPLAAHEVTVQHQQSEMLIRAGLISVVEARAKLMGETLDEARAALEQVRVDTARFGRNGN